VVKAGALGRRVLVARFNEVHKPRFISGGLAGIDLNQL
jgi:hypothetical protein